MMLSLFSSTRRRYACRRFFAMRQRHYAAIFSYAHYYATPLRRHATPGVGAAAYADTARRIHTRRRLIFAAMLMRQIC